MSPRPPSSAWGVLVFVAIGVVVQLKDANLGSARLILKRARSFNQ